MSVRQLPNGKWAADVTVGKKWDGKRDRRVVECDTKKKAQKKEAELFLLRERTQGRSVAITFADFVEQVFWPQKQGLRSNTKRGYKRDLKLRLLPAFGNMLLADINHLHVQRMISFCKTRKVATNARETLSAVLGVAESAELVSRNVAKGKYVYPEQSHADPDKYGVWLTSFSEHREFLSYVRVNNSVQSLERILVLALCMGLRKGEVFALDWSHVNLTKREISIEVTYTVGEGKANLTLPKTDKSIRRMPIPKYAQERLQMWLKDDGSSEFPLPIVRTLSGDRMNPHSGDSMLRRFLDNHSDLPRITIFSCRHSFATASIRSGIDVATVSKWLGHTNVSTTYDKYVKPLLSDLHKDVSIIDFAYQK